MWMPKKILIYKILRPQKKLIDKMGRLISFWITEDTYALIEIHTW